MNSISTYIKRVLLAAWIAFAGILIPANDSFAVIVKHDKNQNGNYQMHYQIVIFNSLSTFQNTYNKQPGYGLDEKPGEKTKNGSGNNLLDTSKILTVKNKNNYLLTSDRTGILEKNGESGLADLSVGSFLDDFKNDPTTRNIYFTSKDLIFSYKNEMNNILQLDIDTEQVDIDRLRQSEQDKLREREGAITGNMEKKIKQGSSSIFTVISELYKMILLALAGMAFIIYMIFRYFLNKYI